MRTSEAGREFIRGYETLRLDVYLDAVGKPTVGWGHLIVPRDALKMGDTITRERADALFDSDLLNPEDAVNDIDFTGSLKQHEFDALVSFVFNAGRGAFDSSTMRRLLIRGDKARAAMEFPRWNKGRTPGGAVIVLAGLTKRRMAEQRMFREGVYDSTH